MDSKVDNYLKRRIWKADGVYYFCRMCGDYMKDSAFYPDKNKNFGVSYTCKLHTKKEKKTEEDKDFDYLKMSRITDNDFDETQRLLENLGFRFGHGELPVHEQFRLKHNL